MAPLSRMKTLRLPHKYIYQIPKYVITFSCSVVQLLLRTQINIEKLSNILADQISEIYNFFSQIKFRFATKIHTEAQVSVYVSIILSFLHLGLRVRC